PHSGSGLQGRRKGGKVPVVTTESRLTGNEGWKKEEIAGRPVSRVLCHGAHPEGERRATVISLAARLPVRSSSLPESRNGPDRPCPLIWPCSRWGLPSQPVTKLLVRSYSRFSPTQPPFAASSSVDPAKGGRVNEDPHLFTLT